MNFKGKLERVAAAALCKGDVAQEDSDTDTQKLLFNIIKIPSISTTTDSVSDHFRLNWNFRMNLSENFPHCLSTYLSDIEAAKSPQCRDWLLSRDLGAFKAKYGCCLKSDEGSRDYTERRNCATRFSLRKVLPLMITIHLQKPHSQRQMTLPWR